MLPEHRKPVSYDRYSSRGEQTILELLHRDHIHPDTRTDIILEATRPDFLFHDKKLAVYLDGPPHILNPAKEEWDEKIADKLQERGWTVLRIRYKPPLGRSKAQTIAAEIKKILEAHPP